MQATFSSAGVRIMRIKKYGFMEYMFFSIVKSQILSDIIMVGNYSVRKRKFSLNTNILQSSLTTIFPKYSWTIQCDEYYNKFNGQWLKSSGSLMRFIHKWATNSPSFLCGVRYIKNALNQFRVPHFASNAHGENGSLLWTFWIWNSLIPFDLKTGMEELMLLMETAEWAETPHALQSLILLLSNQFIRL